MSREREQKYIQKLACVLCKKVLAIMGTHRHHPGPVLCPKCLTKKNKDEAKKKAPNPKKKAV